LNEIFHGQGISVPMTTGAGAIGSGPVGCWQKIKFTENSYLPLITTNKKSS
jgi:hypothetical protein